MRFVHMSLVTWMCALVLFRWLSLKFSKAACSPMDSCPKLPLPPPSLQPDFPLGLLPSPSALSSFAAHQIDGPLSSPVWNDPPLPVLDQFHVSIWIFFFYGVMPMFIERGLSKRPTFDLIAAKRRNSGPSFKIKQLVKASFYLFHLKFNNLCSTSRNNYMVLYIINWWHSTIKLCTTFSFFMLLEVVMRKQVF